EPLAFLGMAIYGIGLARRSQRNHPNQTALAWTVGCCVMAFVGAGFLGFAHTLPQVNLYTHGTLVTAMHGHLAFWGAYAMLVLAIMTYALPILTGRNCHKDASASFAFWTSNIGMLGMTGAFAVAGVTQVYLERRVGLECLDVQREIEVHFLGLVMAATLFTTGIIAYIWNFIRYGLPVAVPAADGGPSDPDASLEASAAPAE